MQDSADADMQNLLYNLREEAAAATMRMAKSQLYPKTARPVPEKRFSAIRLFCAFLRSVAAKIFSHKKAPASPSAAMVPSAPACVVFKHTRNTFITPIGNYAGKPSVNKHRLQAIKQFNAMYLSQDATIN